MAVVESLPTQGEKNQVVAVTPPDAGGSLKLMCGKILGSTGKEEKDGLKPERRALV